MIDNRITIIIDYTIARANILQLVLTAIVTAYNYENFASNLIKLDGAYSLVYKLNLHILLLTLPTYSSSLISFWITEAFFLNPFSFTTV